MAMHEELNQFKRNNVLALVLKPEDHIVIETWWVFRNKLDENDIIIHNKAKLISKGYNQGEDIEYNEIFIPIARLKAISMLLAFTYARKF